jgi:NADH-quinone oxidoreductase subunit C
MDRQTLIEKLNESFTGEGLTVGDTPDMALLTVEREQLVDICKKLRHDAPFHFDYLMSVTAVDRPEDNIFELVYHLYAMGHRCAVCVKTTVPRDNPIVPSVSEIWPAADWHERETYDLFGVLFAGHKDLRRILLPDEWEGFPLRKDYQDDFMLVKD